MFHQQDEMVSSYLFSFREASYPLFWISEFCLHSYLAPLKCQQNLGLHLQAVRVVAQRSLQGASAESCKHIPSIRGIEISPCIP